DEKSRPMSVAGRLIKKIIYGENHPYGKKETEASLKSINLADVKEYFKTYFKPNNASLVVVGNISEKEIVGKLEISLAKWKEGEVPKINIPKSEQLPLGVYFIKRPASVQSTISLVTKGLPTSDDAYETLSLASNLMGSSFGGRLFRTLREQHSYTYTPFGRLGQNKYANTFVCGADVRNAVTDSAIDVIKEQMRLMATEPATDEELNRIKKYEIGEYQMSFENGGFIGGLLQIADFHKISFEKIKAYPQIIASMNPYDIQRISAKYINPESAYIVVVGNQSVRDKLDRFGKVYEFDLDLNPTSGESAKMEKVSMDAKELIKKYINAIGGKEAVANAKTIITEGTAKMKVQGQDMEGTIKVFEKYPNKMYQSIDLGMIQQKIWVDGTNVLTESFGTSSKLEGKELEKRLAESKMFKETELASGDNKCEVLGKQGNDVLLKVLFKDGEEKLYYFDAVSFLLNKVESNEETPQGPMPVTITFGNYEKVNGVMLPKLLETTFPMFSIKVINTHKVNEPIDDSIFSTENKK
ncbi:MAG: pitrilysin family protein, partial [Ignavibacteria bacterium]|nr:pitrilysin family protein [Ignavibacteria bacterium]